MAEQRILSINPANWITVVLMVSIAFAVAGAVYKIYQQRKAMTANA